MRYFRKSDTMEACSYIPASSHATWVRGCPSHTHPHIYMHTFMAILQMLTWGNILTPTRALSMSVHWLSKMSTQQKFQLQKVQVDFWVADGLPEDTHQYVIKRDHIRVALSSSRLPPLISKSKANLSSQCCEPGLDRSHDSCVPEHWPVWEHRGSAAWADAKSMFDSERMPIVKLKRVLL